MAYPTYSVMTRAEWKEEFAKEVCGRVPRILTKEEVEAKFANDEHIFYVAKDGDTPEECFVFFCSTYFFSSLIGSDFVHVSSIGNMSVSPRPGVEDGVTDTLEKFTKVFHEGYTHIYTEDHLIDVLDALGRELVFVC